MSTWILILTILTYDSNFIHSVPGFKDRDACMAAAHAWLDLNKKKSREVEQHNALCVEQKK